MAAYLSPKTGTGADDDFIRPAIADFIADAGWSAFDLNADQMIVFTDADPAQWLSVPGVSPLTDAEADALING